MRLFIEGSAYRPSVIFDLEKRYLRIDGMSSMPDSRQFYQNLMDWLLAHKSHIAPGTQLIMRLMYLNSGSHKALLNFFSEISSENIPLSVTFIRTERLDNSEEVELLLQICRQVGLSCKIQSEDEHVGHLDGSSRPAEPNSDNN
ncbi:MAG: DUF1987 domain-containing protein [Bacteroidia bacterium]|nr:DUF1987 domain-containing protein [Bacteroidia bacterium]MCX7652060.1 DUF1987 domain-containing protein [Bacteroidia bacterium]MDW8416954.1 SiaC family regulatory phosphoprotein [Bacteroidia bacterium]